MSKDLLNRVKAKAKQLKAETPTLREGQALMNALSELDEQVYELVLNTDADCFYNSTKVPTFNKKVLEAA